MLEQLQDLCLPHEALPELGGGGKLRADHLDRADDAVEAGVLGAPHLPHPPGTDELDEAKVAQH